MLNKMRGVTLIELVVVVAIVALLATIAIPSYRQFVLRSHRAEAKSALLDLAAAQEKCDLKNNTYTDAIDDAPPDGLGLLATTEGGYYTIAVDDADADSFTATATAAAGQAELGTRVGDDETASVFAQMDPDDRGDLLDELPAVVASRLMRGLSPAERGLTATVLGYPKGSTGREMSPEVAVVPQDMDAATALRRVLGRLYDPPAGAISVDGVPLTDLDV